MSRSFPIALVLLLAFSGSARASQVVANVNPPFGPFLSGSDIVWGERTADNGIDVKAATPGAEPRLLHHIPGRGTAGTSDQFRLLVSDSHLAWRRETLYPCGKGGECTGFTELWAGPIGGPFEGVARCDGIAVPYAPALSGDTLVYAGAGCSSPATGAVVVRQLRDGDDALRTIPIADGYVSNVSVEGNFLAYMHHREGGATVRVHDIAAGADVYALSPGSFGSGPLNYATRSDVQGDGKAGFVFPAKTRPDDGPQQFGFASPAEPRNHALPTEQSRTGRATYPIEMAGDRIAFARQVDRCTPFSPALELAVTDLAGNQGLLGPLNGYFIAGNSRQDAFDFDGTRVTWAGNTPSGPAILLQDIVAEPPPPTTNGPVCPVTKRSEVSIRGGRVKVSRSGRARIRLSCTAAIDSEAVPCRGRLELEPEGGGGLLASGRFSVGAGRSGSAVVKLRSRALERLRRRRSLLVDVLAVSRPPATNGFNSVRLVAPRLSR